MRSLALFLLGLTATVSAQDLAPEAVSILVLGAEAQQPLASVPLASVPLAMVDTLSARAQNDELYAAALGASGLAILGGIPLAREIGGPEGVAVVVVAVPLAAALGTQAMSDMRGLEGSFGGALGNAALGALIGAGVGAGTGLLLGLMAGDNVESYNLAAWTAITIAAAGPGFYAARRRARLNHVAGPVLQIRPDGRLALGASLRIGL